MEKLLKNFDEPHFFAVGTEVSAKYKGGFFEAKISKISKTIKCKVKYSSGISVFVTDDAVKGELKVGAIVDVECSDEKDLVRATIQKIQDCSQYTVVFNDGDITCLKRTALRLKSGRRFSASSTFDQLPLAQPPVKTTIAQCSRIQNHKTRKSGGDEASAMEEKDIGKVVCIEINDKNNIKDNWFPGLIVAPTSQSSVRINVAEDYLVRSFKDGYYYTVPKKEIIEFTKEIGARVKSSTLETAVKKALFFLDKDELPPHWDRGDMLFGVDKNTDSEAFDNDNSDEESIEKKDNFVTQLFKFMCDRGTPLNQASVINDNNVDLYKLFKVVNKCGGYSKVDKGKLWKYVENEAGYDPQLLISVQHFYQLYLHSFEDFYRKLGYTMLSRPRRVRSRSKFNRSIVRDTYKTDKNKNSFKTTKSAKIIKVEKKKSMQKTNNKEKVPTVKSADTGLLGMNSFKKSKRGASNAQLDTSNKGKLDEEVPKPMGSEEDLPTKSIGISQKNVPSTTERIKRSVSPNTPHSCIKKIRCSSAQPTGTCTLTEHPSFNIDNFDSDGKFTVSVGSSKPHEYNLNITFNSEDEEQNKFKKRAEIIASPLGDKSDKSKISGTDFDLHKIIPEMKGLMPVSNNEILQNTESFIPDQLTEIEVPKIIESVTDDIYEIKVSESCNFDVISSDELSIVIDCTAQEEVIEQKELMIPFVPNSSNNIMYSFDNDVEIKVNEHLNLIEIEDTISHNQFDDESNESQNLTISDIAVNISCIKEIEQHSQDETCHKVNVSNLKDKVFDLCIKSPESLPNNIFSISEPNELKDMIVEEDYDNESKSVIAENDKIETDCPMNTNLKVISEGYNSFNGQIDENIKAQFQSFQMHSYFENHLRQNSLYIENFDDNIKSGFKFDSNTKSPAIENNEIIESFTKLSINEPSYNDKPKQFDYEVKNFKNKYKKENTMMLPEFPCREEIVDEDTLNNALVIQYNSKVAEYDIYEPSTSKGFYESMHYLGISKDSFYETNPSSDVKNSFFKATQTVKSVTLDTNVSGKSSLFDPNILSCNSKDLYDYNIPSSTKSSFYENSIASTNNNFYNTESIVNSILFCEETVPCVPTGTSEEQYDHEVIEAALVLCAMSQSFRGSKITLMGSTKTKNMEEHTNILQKDDTILDQRHLQFLAEISTGNQWMNINRSSVTEPFKIELENFYEKIVNISKKPQSMHRISIQQSSERSKLSTTTVPIPSVHHDEKPVDVQISKLDGKPLVDIIPGINSTYSRMTAKLNVLRKHYVKVNKQKAKLERNKKIFLKRDMLKAKAATSN